ncbi:peptide/nickel transport system permease protein [Butyrivibrio sp. ob235]|uniref:ABC transporter permease n=1 Tax=Butyrivibrio sp. ob235 TaxID=1761780 RepID=UPI0008D065EE|nr:ABC transporter permease [Butyrivibrio sp. ob235]SEL02761.1 peptide/nickel transport system permease protein [Butyrivibrio sp. ob235]
MKELPRRILGVVIVLIGVIALIFIMLRIIPGDPVSVLLNEHVSQANIDRLTQNMGLDKSLPEQFLTYLLGVFRGDLGRSYTMQQPVLSLILQAFPYTVRLTLLAIAFAWTIGIVSGVISAMYNEKFLDYLFRGTALLGISVPVFMVALFLQYMFYFRLSLLPLVYDGSFVSLILPAIALGWNSAGSVARLTRSSLMEQLGATYIDTARAKGLVYKKAVVFHALKNAILPVITMMALQLAEMLSGAVITESVFSISGLGKLALTALQTRDMPLLQGTVLFTAFLIAVGGILADIIGTILNPKLRLG